MKINREFLINSGLLIVGIIVTIAGLFFIESKRGLIGQMLLILGLGSLVYSSYRIIVNSTKN